MGFVTGGRVVCEVHVHTHALVHTQGSFGYENDRGGLTDQAHTHAHAHAVQPLGIADSHHRKTFTLTPKVRPLVYA